VVANLNGDVIRIGGRSTWVRTNEFIVKPVINWTATGRQVRFTLPVGVSYRPDPEQVRQVLLDVARVHPDGIDSPGPT